MNLSALAVRHPRVLAVALVTTVVWGLISLVTLPRQEDPVLTWRLANVVTRLPGATPLRMESLVTDVLEDHVKEVDEVEHIYSVSRAGVSLVQIELADDVTNAAPVWQKVRHKLSEAAIELPEGAVGPDLDDEIMGTFTALIALTGEKRSYRELKDFAERLEDRLRFLADISSTSLFGEQTEVIEIEVDPSLLAAYDLSFHDVAAAVRQRNTRQPSGRLRVDESELLVEASGEIETEQELADMVLLATHDQRTLTLGQIAAIERRTTRPAEPLARVNGQRSVIVGVRARNGVRTDVVGRQVREIVEEFQKTLPRGVAAVVFHDMAQYAQQRWEQLARTLMLSITFVFLSTTAFMGWRAAGVVTAAIPTTGMIVLVSFSLLGVPLNQMSIMAIIMAMGLIVDNAIVVTEQIHRKVNEGEDAKRAACEQPNRLFVPLAVSTLTTIAAFLPIYMLPGGTGEFVRAIPIGVSVCLLTSLLVAMTVVPLMAALVLPRIVRGSGRDGLEPAWMRSLSRRVRSPYERLLQGTLARPVLSFALVAVLLASCAALGLTLRRDFFSPVQRDQFVIDVYTPQGSAVAHTEEIVEEVERLLSQQAEVETVGAFVGRNAPLVFYNLTSQETYANHFSQLIVNVTNWRNTARVAENVQRLLDQNIVGADCVVHILEHGAPFIAPFEIRIRGPSIETLNELGRRVGDSLADTPGVRNVRSNYGNEVMKLVVEVNEPVAKSIGLNQRTVADELRYRLDGLVASHMQESDERIDIAVRLPENRRASITDLASVNFNPLATAAFIPFSTVARLVPKWEAASIYRRDGQRTLTVLAYPVFGQTAAQVSKRFAERVDVLARDLPSGYTMELGGENEQRETAESNLIRKGVYAFWLVVLLLMIEFRSFRLSGLILFIVPLSLAGTMLGLYLTGWPLNFMAIMGMMMLIGVVVNDAVILVDGYERRRQSGQVIRDVIVEGTLDRTRHIVVTTVTTIAGFLPLALSPSLLWPPLAIAIIGGLALSTLLTLVAVPAAYFVLRRP